MTIFSLPKIVAEENVLASICYTAAPSNGNECGLILGDGPFPLDANAFKAQHGSVLIAETKGEEERCFENKLVPKTYVIRNGRQITKQPQLSTHGFELVSGLSLRQANTHFEMSIYLYQVENIVKQVTGAQFAKAYCHVQRTGSTLSKKNKTSGYAGYAHTDQAHESWSTSLRDNLHHESFPSGLSLQDASRVKKASRHAVVSAWRYLGPRQKCLHSHLALLDPTTLQAEDFMHFSLRCRSDNKTMLSGSNYRLNAAQGDRHSWWYFPGMDRDSEILLFTVYDSNPTSFHNADTLPIPTVFHSAFRDPRTSVSHEPERESIDVRVFLVWE